MPAILEFMESQVSGRSIPVGKVLEVGSMDINGTARTVFQHRATGYFGCDIAPGRCVDFVIDGERVTEHFPEASFDTVICCEMLEHCVHPWLVVNQLRLSLRPGGHLWISTPTFGFPEHRFPVDCYRFGEDAYRLWMFVDYDLLALSHVVDHLDQPAIVAVGRKPVPAELSLRSDSAGSARSS